MLIGLVQAGIILLVCLLWFRIPFAGSFFDLYVALSLFTLSVVGLGLCISALSVTMQQAFIYCFVLVMPMMLLSGLVTPLGSMPELLQTLTYANPVRFALDCVRRIYLEGAGLADIATNFIPMLCTAAVTMPLAGWMFRHRLS